MKQYVIVRIKDNKLLGYIIGKTQIQGRPYLIYQAGNKTGRIAVTNTMQRLYRVDVQLAG